MEIVEVNIPPGSPAIGKKVEDLPLSLRKSTLALVIRKGQSPLLPTSDTVLEAEDQVIAVTEPESEPAIRSFLAGGK